jgi:peptidoglycan-associated lipoprotein
MKTKFAQLFAVACLFTCMMLLGACAKKTVAAKAPGPPPPSKPAATLTLSRTDIQKGENTVLSWTTQNANDVTISGIGTVTTTGSKTVTPNDSATYNLMAKGPGGEAEASARVTVTTPPPVAAVHNPTLDELFTKQVKDVFFDYDKYAVRESEQANAAAAAKFLQEHPGTSIVIEGHCDERGSEEYNLALGDNRAGSTRDYLLSQGISKDRVKTTSYGKEKPFCTDDNDNCWQQNRRAHFVLQQENTAQGGN